LAVRPNPAVLRRDRTERGAVRRVKESEMLTRRGPWLGFWLWRRAGECWERSCRCGNRNAAPDTPHTCGPGELCNGSQACPHGKCRNLPVPGGSKFWVLPMFRLIPLETEWLGPSSKSPKPKSRSPDLLHKHRGEGDWCQDWIPGQRAA
jgi:hypothetical protein